MSRGWWYSHAEQTLQDKQTEAAEVRKGFDGTFVLGIVGKNNQFQ